MEKNIPSICFILPSIFLGFFIIIQIIDFFLSIKYFKNAKKMSFLYGMIVWGIVIGIVYDMILLVFPDTSDSSALIKILSSLFLGLLPAILEDIGRLITFLYIFKSKNNHYENSVVFGLGYGGFESIVLLAIEYINYFISFNKINNSSSIDDKSLMKTYNDFKDGLPAAEYMNIVMRIFGILYHTTSSVIIFRSSLDIKNRKYLLFFIFVFFVHFLVDSLSNIFSKFELNAFWHFTILGITIGYIILGFFFYKKEYSDQKNEDVKKELNELANEN